MTESFLLLLLGSAALLGLLVLALVVLCVWVLFGVIVRSSVAAALHVMGPRRT